MSRVKIEDLSVERTLAAGESQVRGGGKFRVSVGSGHNRLVINSGGPRRRHDLHEHHHPRADVYFYDTSHWDYVPGQYLWDCDHYDYIPGHWVLHETGHFPY